MSGVIPSRVRLAGGMVTVKRVKTTSAPLREGEDVMGYSMFRPRIIEVVEDLRASVAMSTFYHELAHFALFDAGVHNLLSDAKLEAVCDAIGLAFMHAKFQ